MQDCEKMSTMEAVSLPVRVSQISREGNPCANNRLLNCQWVIQIAVKEVSPYSQRYQIEQGCNAKV